MELKKILIVDDDAGIRRIAELSLTKVGKLDVTLAKSGAEALEMVKSQRPDLILLDVMMPGMDGPSTFLELRRGRETADIPVILLTAKVQGADQKRFASLGVSGVLFKPFDPMTLAQQMSDTLGWKD